MVTLSILWGDLPAAWIPSNGQHFANTSWIIATWFRTWKTTIIQKGTQISKNSQTMTVGSIQAIFTWVFPKIGVPQNGWFIMEIPIKMDDLQGKPTIFGNIHISSSFSLVKCTQTPGPPSLRGARSEALSHWTCLGGTKPWKTIRLTHIPEDRQQTHNMTYTWIFHICKISAFW